MHYVVTKQFDFGGTTRKAGDQITGSDYTAVSTNQFYHQFVVAVLDGSPPISNGNTNTNTGSGGTDVPVSAGTYSIPAAASTSGVLSVNPVRILDISNTDSAAQGAILKLFDASDVSQITTARCFFSVELGASQIITLQRLTTIGLVWQIVQGDGGATALNSTGGVDISYAAS